MAVLLCLMTKIRNLSPKSFSHIKYFPGTVGNPFDVILHAGTDLDKRLPAWLFAVILAVLAIIGNLPATLHERGLPWYAGFLFLFFLSDWLLIALLPLTRRSFGPVKPVVLMLAVLRIPFYFLPLGWNIAFEVIGTLLVIYGFYLEPFRLDVHHETFVTAKLSPGHHIRLVHLGDLHLEHSGRREEEIQRKLKELSPDLILFSGDVLNLSYLHDPQSQAEARGFFSALSAPLGVYAVSGSPAVDLPDVFPSLVKQTPLQWLDDRAATQQTGTGALTIYGLTCSHDPAKDDLALQKLLQKNPLQDGSFNVLLHHSPDLAPLASRYGFDMQLSGHTHGGQIRLPFYGALFSGSLYKKTFEAGRYLVNGMTLYVSRGLGMEGAIAPRVRVLCPPEMIVWEITNKSEY